MFPGIENLEYYKVNMNAGDCVYIPFKWLVKFSYFTHINNKAWWKFIHQGYIKFALLIETLPLIFGSVMKKFSAEMCLPTSVLIINSIWPSSWVNITIHRSEMIFSLVISKTGKVITTLNLRVKSLRRVPSKNPIWNILPLTFISSKVD